MADGTPDDGGDAPLPPNLRFLKGLVTVLTAVMILGVITIVLLLVMRLSDDTRPILVHPELFEIPPGVGTVGYSVINDYTVLVGDDGIIRVFASDTLEQVGELDTNAPPAE